MSIEDVERVISELAHGKWGVLEVEALLSATGRSIGGREGRRLAQLLDEGDGRLSAEGRALLADALGRKTAPATPGVRFTSATSWRTDVPEPSGLAFVSTARGFIAVGDDSSALYHLAIPEGPDSEVRAERVEIPGGKALRGVEGVAYDRDADAVLLVNERTRLVHEIAGGMPRVLGQLQDFAQRDKGWEGITVLPRSLSPDGSVHLLCVHEDAPKGLALLDRTSLRLDAWMPFPEGTGASDLSDVTVDPLTGHVFVLADESGTIHELELVRGRDLPGEGNAWRLSPLGVTAIPHKKSKRRLQPEGLDFDAKGDLWLVAERDQVLIKLARAPVTTAEA